MFKCNLCDQHVHREDMRIHAMVHELEVHELMASHFEPIYFKCSHCEKEKATLRSKGYTCDNCSHVTPGYAFIKEVSHES